MSRDLGPLRWHDWIEPIDLYDQLELEPSSQERNSHMVALSRLIKRGIVERRLFKNWSYSVGPIETSCVRLAPNALEVMGCARA